MRLFKQQYFILIMTLVLFRSIVFLQFPLKNAQAEDDSAIPYMTLESLIEKALRLNPEIRSKEASYKASLARIHSVKIWNDPKFGVGFKNPIEPESRFAGEIGLTVAQDIPFPGKLTLTGKVAKRQAEANDENYRFERYQIISSVKRAFYDYLFLWNSREIIQRTIKNLKDFLKVAEINYSVGKGNQTDVLRARLEVLKFDERMKIIEESLSKAVIELEKLTGQEENPKVVKPVAPKMADFKMTLADLLKTADSSPEIISAELEKYAADKLHTLSKLQYLPDFSLEGGWWKNRLDGTSRWELQVGITLPVFFLFKQRYQVKEAGYNLVSATNNAAAVRLKVRSDIKKLFLDIETNRDLINLYKNELIPQATMSMDSVSESYKVGKVDFLALIDSIVNLEEFEIAYAQKFSDYEKAIASIEGICGTSVSEIGNISREAIK